MSSSPPPLGAPLPSSNASARVDFRPDVDGGAIAAATVATVATPASSLVFFALAASLILWLMNCRSLPGLWYACVLSPTNANRDLYRGVMCAICAAAAADYRIGETYTERGALEFPGSARRGERN